MVTNHDSESIEAAITANLLTQIHMSHPQGLFILKLLLWTEAYSQLHRLPWIKTHPHESHTSSHHRCFVTYAPVTTLLCLRVTMVLSCKPISLPTPPTPSDMLKV